MDNKLFLALLAAPIILVTVVLNKDRLVQPASHQFSAVTQQTGSDALLFARGRSEDEAYSNVRALCGDNCEDRASSSDPSDVFINLCCDYSSDLLPEITKMEGTCLVGVGSSIEEAEQKIKENSQSIFELMTNPICKRTTVLSAADGAELMSEADHLAEQAKYDAWEQDMERKNAEQKAVREREQAKIEAERIAATKRYAGISFAENSQPPVAWGATEKEALKNALDACQSMYTECKEGIAGLYDAMTVFAEICCVGQGRTCTLASGQSMEEAFSRAFGRAAESGRTSCTRMNALKADDGSQVMPLEEVQASAASVLEQERDRAEAERRKNLVRFEMQSEDRYALQLKFFSADRKYVWPGNNKHHPLKDSDWHTYEMSCEPGERLCFGASRQSRSKYWGLGMDGSYGCKGCCAVCGTTLRTTLTDGGSEPAPVARNNNNNNGAGDGISVLNAIIGGAALGLNIGAAINNSGGGGSGGGGYTAPPPRGPNWRDSGISGN